MKTKLPELLTLLTGATLLPFLALQNGSACSIDYWNFTDERQNPIVVNNPNFLGYFIPSANQEFEVGDTLWQFAVDASHPNAAWFSQGKHDGIDIIGWVEKVPGDGCAIHFFENDKAQVRPTLEGIANADNREGGGINIYHEPAPMSQYELYGHLTVSSLLSFPSTVKEDTILGVIHRTDPSQFVHLHYAETDEDGNYLDPQKHLSRGTCICPDSSSTLALLCMGLLVMRLVVTTKPQLDS